MMKKSLLLSFLLVAFISLAFEVNAATPTPSNNFVSAAASSHVRVRYFTRRVRYGRFIYRETYRVLILRNGRTYAQLVDRDKIGRINDFDRY